MSMLPLHQFDLTYDAGNRKKYLVRPLSFDQVNNSQAPTSKAFIFRFHTEILSMVLEHVDPVSLREMALVDCDFRQLARSRQFACLKLDYSERSWDLLSHIMGGLWHRDNGDGSVKQSIFSCVRQIRVYTDQGLGTWPGGCRGRLREWHLNPAWNMGRELKEARWRYSILMHKICTLIGKDELGSHLEAFEFVEYAAAGQKYFNFESLLTSGITRLRLADFWIKEKHEALLPMTIVPGQYLQSLRSLSLLTKKDDHGMLALLICLCSTTLEQLVWQGDLQTPQCFNNKDLEFPELRELRLLDVCFADPADLSCLLRAPLTTLSISLPSEPAISTLEAQGNIPTLRTLEMILYNQSATSPTSVQERLVTFLRHHPQLSKLKFSLSRKWPVTCDNLLRVLSGSSQNLKSLSFPYDGTIPISSNVSKYLGLLRSLEQIHITFRGQVLQDLVSNSIFEDLQVLLSELPRLKRVVFTKQVDFNQMSSTIQRTEHTSNWGNDRAKFVEKGCTKYFASIPGLELFHLSPFTFVGKDHWPVLQSPGLDNDFCLIRKMFGCEAEAVSKQSPKKRQRDCDGRSGNQRMDFSDKKLS